MVQCFRFATESSNQMIKYARTSKCYSFKTLAFKLSDILHGVFYTKFPLNSIEPHSLFFLILIIPFIILLKDHLMFIILFDSWLLFLYFIFVYFGPDYSRCVFYQTIWNRSSSQIWNTVSVLINSRINNKCAGTQFPAPTFAKNAHFKMGWTGRPYYGRPYYGRPYYGQ